MSWQACRAGRPSDFPLAIPGHQGSPVHAPTGASPWPLNHWLYPANLCLNCRMRGGEWMHVLDLIGIGLSVSAASVRGSAIYTWISYCARYVSVSSEAFGRFCT